MAFGTLPITPGSGKNVAVDTIAGAEYQRVKLLDGSADGTGAIGGDATNGLDVDVTRVVPGTSATHLGKAEDAAHSDGDTGVLLLGVRNYAGAGADSDYSALSVDTDGMLKVRPRANTKRFTGTIPGTAAAAYAAGDHLGTVASVSNAVAVSGGGGDLVGITVFSVDDAMGSLDVVLLRDNPAAVTDNGAFNLDDADAGKVIKLVALNGAYDLGGCRIAQAANICIPIDCVGTTLYLAFITRSGWTLATAPTFDLHIKQA